MNLLTIGFSNEQIDEFKRLFSLKYSISTASNANLNWWDIHNFRLNTVPYNEGLTNHEISELIRCFEIYSDMNTRRYAVVHGQHSETKNLLMLQANFASSILNDQEIQLIFFENMPHEGFDFVFYTLAKLRGIRTIITNQTQFSNRFWIIGAMENYGNFNGPKISAASEVDLTLPAEWFYVPKKRKFTKPRPILKLLKSTLTGPQKIPVHLLEYFYNRRFIKSNQMSVSNVLDNDEDYIYYPLHMQPEMNVTALAGKNGVYSDQLLILETLREKLSPDIKIIVKENPKQTFKCRDEYFYKRLNAISNLQLISKQYNSRDLIIGSIGVVTLSGTAGWEALCLGKPCLTFGNAWYNSLPGVTMYSSNLNLDNWLSQKQTPFARVEQHMRDLMQRCGKGVVDQDYIAIVDDFNPKKNATCVAASLKKYLAKCP